MSPLNQLNPTKIWQQIPQPQKEKLSHCLFLVVMEITGAVHHESDQDHQAAPPPSSHSLYSTIDPSSGALSSGESETAISITGAIIDRVINDSFRILPCVRWGSFLVWKYHAWPAIVWIGTSCWSSLPLSTSSLLMRRVCMMPVNSMTVCC